MSVEDRRMAERRGTVAGPVEGTPDAGAAEDSRQAEEQCQEGLLQHWEVAVRLFHTC